jgi:DNA polymerase III epsilon subunit-like protein
MKIITLDLETTGLPPKNGTYETHYMDFPHILSMAWKINDQPRYEYLINPEGKYTVPPEATAINGITQEMVDASKFNIFTVLLQFIMDANDSDFIVGHNLYFDTSIIKANVLRIVSGGKTPMDMYNLISKILHKDKRIDTMRACHKLFGGKLPTLSESYQRLFGESFEAHSSGNDVDATYRILQELIRLNAIKIMLPSKVLDEVVKEVICEEEI